MLLAKHMQERNLASINDSAGDRAEQRLRVAAAAVIRMHADRRHLGVIAGLHALAGHRDELAIDPDAEKRSEFMRSRAEGTGFCQLDQRDHLGHVGRARA